MSKIFINSVLVLVCIVFLIGTVSGQNRRDKEKQVRDQILGRSYDGTMLPAGTNGTGPVNVNVSIFLKNILAVDDSNMNMEVQLLMRLEWNDPRLVYTIFPPNTGPNHIILSSPAIQKVWLPDVYIVNAIKADMNGSHKFLKIVPSGDISYSVLVTAKTSCPMTLSDYPHDIQNCEIKISSYGHSSLDIKFVWKETAPINIASDIHRSNFVLESVTNEICDSATTTGTYSCVKVGLSLQRECNYFLIQVYIPILMLVIISWLTYWLHPIRTATGRLVLSIVSLALAVGGCAAFNNTAPKVNYTKAIDIFTGFSLTLIFLSLIEFVIVNYLNQYGIFSGPGKKQQNPGPNGSEQAEQQTPLNPSGEDKGQTHLERSVTSPTASGAKRGALIDVGFRIAVPILFLLFMIIYCIVLNV